MRHVSPHMWAAIDAGNASARQRSTAHSHAARCERCALERSRVLRARGAFADIRKADPGELGWDQIGARIHWTVSSERNAARRRPQKRPRVSWRAVALAGSAATALAIGAVVGVRSFTQTRDAPVAASPAAPPAPAPAAAAAAPSDPLRGVVTFAQGAVRMDGDTLDFDAPIAAGTELQTSEGRVSVQFDAASAFQIGPNSRLRVRALDRGAIELEVTGHIAVDITRRAPDQTFAVIAGDRRVEVRGTAFAVDHVEGRLDVACGRGHVVVTGGNEAVDVVAGQRALFGSLAGRYEARDMDANERETLERRLLVPMLPAWSGRTAATLSETSTLLVEAEPNARAEIDGIEHGIGPFVMRVMPGRHRVGEVWIDVATGERTQASVANKTAPQSMRAEPDGRGPAIAGRRAQLAAAIERGETRLAACLRPLQKLGLVDGSFVILDVGIERSGVLEHLNIVKHNVSPSAANCVRQVVSQVDLPRGSKATFRHRLEF